MTRHVPIVLGAAAVLVALVVGSQLLARPTGGSGGGRIGGTVEYLLDGAPASTRVEAVAQGATVSGSAVTTLPSGTHTVRVECAARDGDTWAFAGTVEQTTVSDERAGDWSAVIVRDASPQRIAIWFSDAKTGAGGCDAWLRGIDLTGIGAENFAPVTAGELARPPDAAS